MISIRYYGHHAQSTGYGHAARELAAALYRAGVAIEIRALGTGDTDWRPPPGMGGPIDRPDVVIVHTLPADCHRVLELEGLRRGDGPKLVAQSTWEALTAPEEVARPLLDNFDQVWLPSRPALAAFTHGGHPGCDLLQLRVIPHCYDELAERPRCERADTDRFRFYWVGAWSARKNPGGLIRAFANAFPAGSRAELVLHSPGCPMEAFVAALAQTGLSQSELPPITLSNKHLSWEALAKLHAEADCFVTAARGEAWNLPAFDALLAGRHVISQYGLGSDEFLLDTSADLIDGWESPAQIDVSLTSSANGEIGVRTIGAQGLTSRSLWLEPSLSSLSDAMRFAFDSRNRTITVRYDVAQRFGYAAVAKQALHVLEQP